jgi:hypothetical protein
MRGAQNKGLYYRAVKMQSKQELPIAYLLFLQEKMILTTKGVGMLPGGGTRCRSRDKKKNGKKQKPCTPAKIVHFTIGRPSNVGSRIFLVLENP